MGGLFAWLMSMKGYFLNPHGPEIKVIKRLYLTLADFSEAIGNEDINDIRNKTVNALREAEEILLTGYIPWKNSFLFNRLYLLNEEGNKLFLEMLELHVNKNKKLPKEFSNMIRRLAMAIDLKDGDKLKIDSYENLDMDYNKFLQIIYDTEAIINLPLTYIGKSIKISKTSLMSKVKRACNKDSIVFINAIRYGFILSISAIIAFSFPFFKALLDTFILSLLSCQVQLLYQPSINQFKDPLVQLLSNNSYYYFKNKSKWFYNSYN